MCDREPIHVPGAIQPHGVLFSIAPQDLTVLQFAGKWSEWDSGEGPDITGVPLRDIIGTEATALLRSVSCGRKPRFLGSLQFAHVSQVYDLIVHISCDDVMVLELEEASGIRASSAETLDQVGTVMADLQEATDLQSLCGIASRVFRRITGFDRVMVYRFKPDGAGWVSAESKHDSLPTFLNHHYPASDIPRQARELYVRNRVRVIPDVYYEPLPVHPPTCPATGERLDMSDCLLRSVSPTHIQYLKNMDVAASASVSIVVDGKLWGLIACHHRQPRNLNYETREVCKHLGQVLAQSIKMREESSSRAQALRLSALREDFAAILARAHGVDETLSRHRNVLLKLVAADGVAIVNDDRISSSGHVPSTAVIRQLSESVLESASSALIATNRLSSMTDMSEEDRAVASGLLATRIEREDRLAILWFRAEEIETVNWAGNPHKPVEAVSLGVLNPRRSFEIWSETVRGHARPWSDPELEAARRFANTLTVLRQQERLKRTLAENEKLMSQKDLLMKEADHRIQNSIQLIYSMLELQAREFEDPRFKSQIQDTQTRLQAVAMLHRRLWQSGDDHGTIDLGPYFQELRKALLETWGGHWDQHFQLDTVSIEIPTSKAVTLALVIVELLTNAVKYAYGGQEGPIRMSLKSDSPDTLSISVTDQGRGIDDVSTRSGFGSRLIRALTADLGINVEMIRTQPGTAVVLSAKIRSLH